VVRDRAVGGSDDDALGHALEDRAQDGRVRARLVLGGILGLERLREREREADLARDRLRERDAIHRLRLERARHRDEAAERLALESERRDHQ